MLIHRDGSKLIIEPVLGPSNLVDLLAAWRVEEPLGLAAHAKALACTLVTDNTREFN